MLFCDYFHTVYKIEHNDDQILQLVVYLPSTEARLYLILKTRLIKWSVCFQEESTIHIARMLRSNSSLVELHLGKHEMKNFGVERLCEALYENSSLRYLDLSW